MKRPKKKEKHKRNSKSRKRRAKAVLTAIPPGFLDGLPTEDQEAISEMVGKPIRLLGYYEDGRAELEFVDRNKVIHSIFVDPSFTRRVK